MKLFQFDIPFALLMDKEEIWSAVLERIGRKRFGLAIDEEEHSFQYVTIASNISG
jgi:hypothetical protein